MEIAKQIFKVIFVCILFLFSLLVFRQPHAANYDAPGEYIYSAGNAPGAVREQISKQLDKFQVGYTQRDLDRLDIFMEVLFFHENFLVFGTMPDEIYTGYEDVSELIYSDWNTWGDITFLMDNANIASNDNTAWNATIGYVPFGVPSFLFCRYGCQP